MEEQATHSAGEGAVGAVLWDGRHSSLFSSIQNRNSGHIGSSI